MSNELRHTIKLEEPHMADAKEILFNFTHEGLIIDVFDVNGDVVGTSSEMFTEIIERLATPWTRHKRTKTGAR